MRPLTDLLRDLEARGVRLRLNPAHGRLEYTPFDALDAEPELLDGLRQQRRAIEQDLWAQQRRPVSRVSEVPEPAWAIDEPWDV